MCPALMCRVGRRPNPARAGFFVTVVKVQTPAKPEHETKKNRLQETCGRVFVEICDAENDAGIIGSIENRTSLHPPATAVAYAVYFSAVLTDVKEVLRVEPSPLTVAMMARLMPAAISPYSIAVAPDSSARTLRNILFKPALLGRTTPRFSQGSMN